MQTPNPNPPLSFTLKPSRKLQQFNCAAHGLAIIAALSNNLPWLLRLAMAAVVLVDFWITHRRCHHESRTISYSDRQGWRFADGGELEPVAILPTTVITTLAIFLHLKHQPAKLIVHDALAEDDYRQLVVKLKLTANQRPNADNFP